METIIQILVDYGVLGLWVMFSIVREKNLMQRMDDQQRRFQS